MSMGLPFRGLKSTHLIWILLKVTKEATEVSLASKRAFISFNQPGNIQLPPTITKPSYFEFLPNL